MFDIGAPEFVLLIVIAVILFGPERLPELARKAARVVRYIRLMADNAQQQLRNELGPGFEDVDVRDLNPKTFIQKHLMEDPAIQDVKAEVDAATSAARSASDDVTDAVNGVKSTSPGGPAEMAIDLPRVRETTPFDPDAT
jgi:sec-independent protein translocase protein TatB